MRLTTSRVAGHGARRLTIETNYAPLPGPALGSMAVLGVLAAVAVLLSHRLAVQAGAVALAIAGIVTIGVSRLVTTLMLLQRHPQPTPHRARLR